MKKLKFQTRLIIGFCIILSINLSIGIFSIISIKSVCSRTELLHEHPFTVSNAVKDINININAMHRSMKDVAMAENIDQLNTSVKLVNHYDSLNYVAFEIVKKRFLGNINIVEDTYTTYANWEKIRNEVIDLKKEGNEIEAAKITKGKGASHVNLLLNKTKKLTDFAQNKATELYNENLKAEKKSILILITIISFLFLINIIVALVISKSISKPIQKFIKEINQVYKKKDLNTGSFINKSEQEILSETTIELKAAYEKLESFNSELEQKVKIRTKELSDNKEKLIRQNKEYEILNKELSEAETKAIESDRLKSAFLANMSHEIRTPMNAILGFSGFLKKSNFSTDKKIEFIDIIINSGKHLLKLINDIIDLSKINANQISKNEQTCNLNSFLFELIKISQSLIDRKNSKIDIKLINGLETGNDIIYTDKTRLRQILTNLIDNAIKFTSSGSIEIKYLIDDNNMIVFSVKDRGIGISEQELPHIFDRFRQADGTSTRIYGGSGLGLAISKAYTELLGGRIWAESKLGEGSEFYFSISYNPVSTKKIKPVKEKNEITNKSFAGKTILIAEDEKLSFLLLKEMLEPEKVNILHAKNGLQAVELCESNTNIDLILMDTQLPKLDGLNAIRKIKIIRPEIPIISQSANAISEDKEAAFNAGSLEYITKPINKNELFNKIAKYIDK